MLMLSQCRIVEVIAERCWASVVTMSIILGMAKRVTNSNWASGGSFLLRPAGPTEFEAQVRKLGLIEKNYAASRELRDWCERNRHRCYVPEWLLAEWGLRVEPSFSE